MAVSAVIGAETVWVSDIDKGACKILAHRYPNVPNLGDITTIDWDSVEPIDILTGGFPCQDVSHAGKRAGLKPGTRSGLWSHMGYAIQQLKPKMVVIENVRGLLSASSPSDVEPCPWCVGDEPTFDLRALGTVLADLADFGYDARWCGLRAADVGACHGRFRVFVVAHPRRISPQIPASRQHPIVQVAGGNGTQGGPEPLKLLPTPAANDMGYNKTVGWWDDWTNKMRDKHDNTNGHGDSLSIEMYRLADSFADYTPAIQRWENLTGAKAPPPTKQDDKGNLRLSPAFEEWMMGLPPGWVSEVPELSDTDAVKCLGNGVVPQQAVAALHHMIGG